MTEASKPEIVTFSVQQDGFTFLGIENTIVGPIEAADMGAVWGGFFDANGFDKINPYAIETYASMVVYHKNNTQHLIYYIGAMVEGVETVPGGIHACAISRMRLFDCHTRMGVHTR